MTDDFNHENRIYTLEGEIKELKIRCKALEGVFLDDIQKEIAELKKFKESQLIINIEHEFSDEIKELKEQINVLNIKTPVSGTVDNIEEVLRELSDIVENIVGDLHDAIATDCLVPPSRSPAFMIKLIEMNNQLILLKAKLDGDKSVEQVKAEPHEKGCEVSDSQEKTESQPSRCPQCDVKAYNGIFYHMAWCNRNPSEQNNYD